MKYTYAYKTSDGTRHEAAMVAQSREAVFAALRAKGIKAIKVVASDGSKSNGEIRGVRKRVVAMSVIGAAILAVVATVIVVGRSDRTPVGESEILVRPVDFNFAVRHQVIGDSAVIDKGIRTGWVDVFEHEGERFLASFAIPGVPAGLRTTNESEINAALSRKVEARDEDSIETRQIKAMVEGMKDELRKFIADGGTIVEYGSELVKRQETELGYYNRARAEIERAKRSNMPAAQLNELWENRNESLRRMGVKLVPMPE